MSLYKESVLGANELPIEIFCNLKKVEADPEGDLVLTLSKTNALAAYFIGKQLKEIEGKEVYIRVDIGKWEDNGTKE